jgi:hypothetical protein
MFARVKNKKIKQFHDISISYHQQLSSSGGEWETKSNCQRLNKLQKPKKLQESDNETMRLLRQIFIQRPPFNQAFIQRLRFGIEKVFNLKFETVTFTKGF